jgi:hypothetical protein
MKIVALNEVYQVALEMVCEEMKVMGAPVIRAVWDDCYNCFVALEGSHRISAAKILGITPIIDEVSYDDALTIDPSDLDENMNVSVSELIDRASERINDGLVFEF